MTRTELEKLLLAERFPYYSDRLHQQITAIAASGLDADQLERALRELDHELSHLIRSSLSTDHLSSSEKADLKNPSSPAQKVSIVLKYLNKAESYFQD